MNAVRLVLPLGLLLAATVLPVQSAPILMTSKGPRLLAGAPAQSETASTQLKGGQESQASVEKKSLAKAKHRHRKSSAPSQGKA
jgi:hypothetical protein